MVKTESTTKRRAVVRYPVYAVLLYSSAEFRWNLIHTGHTLVVFLPVEYEKGYPTDQGLYERSAGGTKFSSKHRNWCLKKISLHGHKFQKALWGR